MKSVGWKKKILVFSLSFPLSILLFLSPSPAAVVNFSDYYAIGDSLAMGVQAMTASYNTQPYGYVPRLASQIGATGFSLPLLVASLQEIPIYGGLRLDGYSQSHPNVGVGGANTNDVINDRTSFEVTQVLRPRTGMSQLDAVLAAQPTFTSVWIGGNDVLGSVMGGPGGLDGSGITPLGNFTTDYTQIITDVRSTSSDVVVANIPDVASIGVVFSRDDVVDFLGNDYGLPADSFTSGQIVFDIYNGTNVDLSQPGNNLSPGEIAGIQAAIDSFNGVIANVAAANGAALVDIHSFFNDLIATPPTIGGFTISPDWLGLLAGQPYASLFSTDGFHPSDIGYALIANEFVRSINGYYGTSIPLLSEAELAAIVAQDRFVDNDGDGLIENVEGLLVLEIPGITGDLDDTNPIPEPASVLLFVSGLMAFYKKLRLYTFGKLAGTVSFTAAARRGGRR